MTCVNNILVHEARCESRENLRTHIPSASKGEKGRARKNFVYK